MSKVLLNSLFGVFFAFAAVVLIGCDGNSGTGTRSSRAGDFRLHGEWFDKNYEYSGIVSYEFKKHGKGILTVLASAAPINFIWWTENNDLVHLLSEPHTDRDMAEAFGYEINGGNLTIWLTSEGKESGGLTLTKEPGNGNGNSPAKVIITKDNTVKVYEKDVMKYKKWISDANWNEIGVKVEPESPNNKLSARVVKEDNSPVVAAENATPEVGTYYIWYIAQITLNNMTATYADSARRTLIIEPRPNDDNDPPIITLRENNRNPMKFNVTDPPAKFSDPGAIAHTKYSSSVEVTRTFTPEFSTLVSAGILTIQADGDTAVTGMGSFDIIYSAINGDNGKEASIVREVIMGAGPLPIPVIVLTMYKFDSDYGNIESADTVLVEGDGFREPGGLTPTTPQAAGVTAYYMLGGEKKEIGENVKVNYSLFSSADPGTQLITYTIDELHGVHSGGRAERRVFVTNVRCDTDDPPAPASSATPTITIPKGIALNVSHASFGWNVAGKDGGLTTFRLVGYNGLNPQNPQPGSYTLTLVAVGWCGTPAQPLARTVIVE
jgi:hypothetical protein